MTTDRRAAAIEAGVIRLARSLALDVVAEGVSGPDVSRALLALGCHLGQGNALSEPVAPDRVRALLEAQLMPRSGVG